MCNELSEEIQLPADFMPMVSAGRPELACLISSERTLNAEETRAVAHALAVYVKTHIALANEVVELRRKIKDHVGNIRAGVKRLEELAYQFSE